MTVQKLVLIEGQGKVLDRAEALCEAIKATCYGVGEGMPLAAVIGCLEIAKAEILEDSK